VLILIIALWLAPVIICFQKGKPVFAILALFAPQTFHVLAVIGAIRVAKPDSSWARSRYPPGSSLMQTALRRFARNRPAAIAG
jgi:hypothetical protein